MAILGFLFFASVLAVAVWAMFVTIHPRMGYVVALLSGSAAAPLLVPVAQRRRVRRLRPLPLRSELRMIRAAA